MTADDEITITEPKFRPVCECGARAPRWTTAWTAEKWMRRHAEEHQGEPA